MEDVMTKDIREQIKELLLPYFDGQDDSSAKILAMNIIVDAMLDDLNLRIEFIEDKNIPTAPHIEMKTIPKDRMKIIENVLSGKQITIDHDLYQEWLLYVTELTLSEERLDTLLMIGTLSDELKNYFLINKEYQLLIDGQHLTLEDIENHLLDITLNHKEILMRYYPNLPSTTLSYIYRSFRKRDLITAQTNIIDLLLKDSEMFTFASNNVNFIARYSLMSLEDISKLPLLNTIIFTLYYPDIEGVEKYLHSLNMEKDSMNKCLKIIEVRKTKLKEFLVDEKLIVSFGLSLEEFKELTLNDLLKGRKPFWKDDYKSVMFEIRLDRLVRSIISVHLPSVYISLEKDYRKGFSNKPISLKHR